MMNKEERLAIEEVIDLLEHESKHNGRGFWIGNIFVAKEDEISEAIKILRGIAKTKGDNHERA